MKYLKLLIVAFQALYCQNLLAQLPETDPGWQWARFTNSINIEASEKIITDFKNNTISFYMYGDYVIVEDTAFYHPENSYSYNIVIVKRNSDGDFIKAADISTKPGGHLFGIDLEADSDGSIYLCGSFSDTLFVNDSLITLKNPGIDCYVMKFDKELEFIWGRVISSRYQDETEGMTISDDNFLYLTASHFNSLDTSHYMVNYFDQDSADVAYGLTSVLKIDVDGQLIWKAEIRDPYDGFANIRHTISGDNGDIYLSGYASNDIYIQDDTIQYSGIPGYYYAGFIIRFAPDGSLNDAFFIPFTGNGFYLMRGLSVDLFGNYYISTVLDESILFGQDSIILTNDTIYTMVAKMNPVFQPEWHHGIKTTTSFQDFRIDILDDSLAFAFHGRGRFSFFGQEYQLNSIGQVFSGHFSPGGDLVQLQMTDASIGAQLHSFSLDNCGNLITEGLIRGSAHFGNDTLNAGFGDIPFLAKNSHIDPFVPDMPANAEACDSIVLYAPGGHSYYIWNGIQTDRNWIEVDSSTIIYLEVADEDYCWSKAETEVTIWEPIEFSLGNDMDILLSDTLILSAVPGYESYAWSTGDTASTLILPVNNLQIGINQVWLEIANGLCIASDTLMITVIDDTGLEDYFAQGIILFPNPASDFIQIKCDPSIVPLRISLYDQLGINVIEIVNPKDQIDISSLKPGIYITEVIIKNKVLRRSLVVN